jgi:isocitrate lyase
MRLITNADLGRFGYTLQFSTLIAFRSTGLALERTLGTFRGRGLDALADLQLTGVSGPDPEPATRKHQDFCGTNLAGRLHAKRAGTSFRES